jgi:hypothetical protein
VETSGDCTAHRCTDTHLGQKTGDGNMCHLVARKDICKLSSIEAIVATLAKDELAWFWRRPGMNEPTGLSWLVDCSRAPIILQVDDKRTSGPRCCQYYPNAMYNTCRIRNCCLAVNQTLLCINN